MPDNALAKDMMKRFLPIAALVLAACPAAHAAESPWVEVAPDTRMRLISNDIVVNGKTMAAIELDMPAATKTYWRIPGETGIPAQLDLAGSTNVESGEIVWPYPLRQIEHGFVDFVYKGETLLPVALTVGSGAAEVTANVMLGVCDQICVPVRAELALTINPARPDRRQGLRIQQALADVPAPWAGDAAIIGDVIIDPVSRRLDVAIDTAQVDPQSVIIDNGDPGLLFSMPQKSPEAGLVSFELLGKRAGEGLQGQPVRLTFLTANGAFEVSRIVRMRDR